MQQRRSFENDRKGYLKAIVTHEKAYKANSPVSHGFYYKYLFTVDGIEYKRKTMDEKYRPGDSIEVEYIIDDPSKNSPRDDYK